MEVPFQKLSFKLHQLFSFLCMEEYQNHTFEILYHAFYACLGKKGKMTILLECIFFLLCAQRSNYASFILRIHTKWILAE